MAAVFADANFPLLEDGRTFHLGVRAGDVAPRVLSVGDAGRAARIAAAHLDAGGARAPPVESARGFVTHTGAFRGTPVSIVATGMGTPMMDFVVREARAAVGARGGMLVVRFGTCGGLRGEDAAATVVVPSAGSVLLRRDPDAVGAGAASPYSLSRSVLPDAPLTTALLARLRAAAAPLGQAVVEGADVTCDSFYSSQGRVGAGNDGGGRHAAGDLMREVGAGQNGGPGVGAQVCQEFQGQAQRVGFDALGADDQGRVTGGQRPDDGAQIAHGRDQQAEIAGQREIVGHGDSIRQGHVRQARGGSGALHRCRTGWIARP